MSLDIQGLKLAIDTGNPEFYNGRLEDALSELVDEMENVRLILEEQGVDSVEELARLFHNLWTDKDNFDDSVVEEIGGCSCVKEDEDYIYSIHNNNGNKLMMTSSSAKLKEGGDYKIIVREIR